MLLKDFIAKLQEIHKRATEDPKYFDIMGEPAIYTECFRQKDDSPIGVYTYSGYGELTFYFGTDGSITICQKDP